MYQGIAGRTAVVTGGARGIGKSIAEHFLKAGASVLLADMNADLGPATAEELSAIGPCAFLPTDIADEGAVEQAMATASERFGGPDILINNAAAFIMRGVTASVDDWRRMLDVNVMGYALCAKHAAPRMTERGSGAIVNISSMSGIIVEPGLLTYSTTKAAVSHLTRLLALELGPTIRVNAVCPGFVWTSGNADYYRTHRGLEREDVDVLPEVGGKTLLKRTADPAEIAKAVLFLASDDASYITAENLVVDGGYTAL